MKLKKRSSRIISLIISAIILLAAIPVTTSASPADVFDGAESAPVNKNASQVAKNFYQYLWNVRKSDSFIVGATSSSLVGVDTTLADPERDYYKALKDYFGVTPAIFAPFKSIDYQMANNYLPTIVERYKDGSVPLFHIHGKITDVVDSSNIEDPSDYIVNLDKTNSDRDMDLYNEWVAELKKTADYFEQVEKAGIEVYIFKMFSEMNNTNKHGLFGATQKGYTAFHNVWKQAVEYLTVERGLKGVLFAFCPAGFTGCEELYPGDDCVDIIAPTSYSNNGTGPIYETYSCVGYNWMKNRPKPFGFSELGGRGLSTDSPIGDYKETLESIVYAYPETSFAVLWYENRLSLFPPGDYSNNGNYNGDYFMYSPQAIVAEEMVDFRTSTPLKSTGIATFYSGKGLKNKLCNLSLGDFTNQELKSLSIDISNIESLNVLHGCAVAVYDTDDCTGTPKIYYGAKSDLSDVFKSAKSISVKKLNNVAFEKDIWIEGDTQSAFPLNDGLNHEWTYEINPGNGETKITIDLGSVYNIGQMSINNAGFYDNFKYNLRDFAVYTSIDGVNYSLSCKKYGNVLPAANFWFNSTDAQYVQLEIITPNSSTSEIEKNLLSLAEIEVYGTLATGVYDFDSFDDSGFGDYDGYSDNSDFVLLDDETGDYGKEDIVDGSIDSKPKIPKVIIPEFYNYIWIIICGGILLITAAVGLIIFFVKMRKKTAP